jgi:plasmid stabilization system protein ParE
MRRVRVAASARSLFQTMLEQGAEKFGIPVAMEKERLVYQTLETHVAEYPHLGPYDQHLKLSTYHVGRTPFVLVYEYDETEIRVLFIVHERADRLEISDVEW